MGTPNNGLLPTAEGGGPGAFGDRLQQLIQSILGRAGTGGKAGKGGAGAQDLTKYGLPSLKNVPQASAPFNQSETPAARMALLKAMIDRAKNGGVMPQAPMMGGPTVGGGT